MSLSDTLEVIAVSACITTLQNLSGFRVPGALWFQQNYALMWYSAHLASPLYNGFITTSLLMATSMAADRLFAVARPFVHRGINHKWHRITAIVICYFLGLSTGVFEAFRYWIEKGSNRYFIRVDEDYIQTTQAIALAAVQDFIRLFCNVALVVCNIALVICYRLNVHDMREVDEDEGHAAKRKATQRTLVLLTISQSTFTTADITMANIFYIFVYTIPSFTDCYAKVMAPVLELTVESAGILEFFALFAISKHFRKIIIHCFPCKRKQSQRKYAVSR